MSKRRQNSTGNVLASSLSSGSSTVSVDLSAATRCSAMLITSGEVDIETQISPDGFDVSDASAKWFNMFSPKLNADNGGGTVVQVDTGYYSVPMPQSSDLYDLNSNQPVKCGRRMRVSHVNGAGTISSCSFTSSREIG